MSRDLFLLQNGIKYFFVLKKAVAYYLFPIVWSLSKANILLKHPV